MLLYRLLTLLPLTLALQACQDDQVASKPNAESSEKAITAYKKKPADEGFDFTPPEANLSSPDNAVKSWWALTDAIAKLENDECNRESSRQTSVRHARRQLAAGNTKEYFQQKPSCRIESFDRSIERASVETETRAVVIANIKNSTKLPEGLALSKFSKEYVENGVNYKYVLTRESSNWYIEEVYKYNSTNLSLKKDPWVREYKYDKNDDVYLTVYRQ